MSETHESRVMPEELVEAKPRNNLEPGQQERGSDRRTKLVVLAVAAAALLAAGFTGKKAFDERSERNSELTALEAVQAARIDRDIRTGETLPLLNSAVVLLPETQVRDTPAMLKKAFGPLIKDNVAFEVEPGTVLYIARPRLEKDNGSGDESAITWLEFTDQTGQEGGSNRTPEVIAKHTFDVNFGALKAQGQVVVCDLPSEGTRTEGHYNKFGYITDPDMREAAHAIEFARADLRALFEQQGINCAGNL